MENVKLYALENTKERIYFQRMNNNKTCELPFYWTHNKYSCNLSITFFCLRFLSLCKIFITLTCTQVKEHVVILEWVFR